jgi:NADH:ubiquinone oxidoreductase subunit E
MNAVAQLLGVPTATVTGVATFYHYFRLQAAGKFMINVCMGTACYVKGADKVAARFEEELGIEFGQTTTDGQYSLHSAACLGTCGLAPVVMINEQVFSKVTADQVPALLEKTQTPAKAP